ncbi:MAG: hypothetical protein HKN76_06110 [Saprospiraceae bacterium]|nr:hypothetical protein [Saprospiraceae bacterium]
MNLLSKEKQQFNDKKLNILNVISELIGIAIQRTHLQESFVKPHAGSNNAIHDVLKRLVETRIEGLLELLNESQNFAQGNHPAQTLGSIKEALKKTEELREQLALVLSETLEGADYKTDKKQFRYPASPLTARELEILEIVKRGDTNGQIAEQLYISERTVKFHITSILSKLYAKTRTQAVDIALKRGLIGA